jgi:carboxymethylenebutenolidase
MSVDVRTPDGVADAYLTSPADGAAHPGVLVIQDGFGLRPRLGGVGGCISPPNLAIVQRTARGTRWGSPIFAVTIPSRGYR